MYISIEMGSIVFVIAYENIHFKMMNAARKSSPMRMGRMLSFSFSIQNEKYGKILHKKKKWQTNSIQYFFFFGRKKDHFFLEQYVFQRKAKSCRFVSLFFLEQNRREKKTFIVHLFAFHFPRFVQKCSSFVYRSYVLEYSCMCFSP